MPRQSNAVWTFIITALAVFMAALDNLVVTTALPVIRADFDATLSELEWMVNAYTLTFAVLLLTGAALGDRFGRKRLFIIGLATFTAGSLGAALSSTSTELIAARAVQGLGGAVLIAAQPDDPVRSGVARSGGRSRSGHGAASPASRAAIGPLVGGAISEGLAWQWIFLCQRADRDLSRSHSLLPAQARRADHRAHLTSRSRSRERRHAAVVLGLVRGNELGWPQPHRSSRSLAGVEPSWVASFVAGEARTAHPMLPLRLFRSRAFAAANGVRS